MKLTDTIPRASGNGAPLSYLDCTAAELRRAAVGNRREARKHKRRAQSRLPNRRARKAQRYNAELATASFHEALALALDRLAEGRISKNVPLVCELTRKAVRECYAAAGIEAA